MTIHHQRIGKKGGTNGTGEAKARPADKCAKAGLLGAKKTWSHKLPKGYRIITPAQRLKPLPKGALARRPGGRWAPAAGIGRRPRASRMYALPKAPLGIKASAQK